jgi:micrococcal nuclease
MIRYLLAFARFRPTFVVAATLALASPALAEDGPKEAPYTYRAEVVDVVDGDTIDVHIDLGFYVWIRFQRIHLFGIDAPEASGATETAGVAAKDELTSLIKGKMVILKSIRGEDSPDREGSFGNWFGIVWLDGKSINDAMVASGHAVKTGTP